MKNTTLHPALLVFAAFCILNFSASPAQAQEQTREQAIALLTSGIWHFAGVNWSNDRVFDAKGRVLVQASNASGVIKWKIDSKQVSIIFSDHVDLLYLPIDPKGTKGLDQHGNDVVATLVPGSANVVPETAGTPSGLDALKPLGGASFNPMSPAELLTAKKWHFAGGGWSETRVFTTDGLMTIEDNKNTARWQITSKQVVMTFRDHKDILFLPLDPKGTKGMDEYGRLIIATQGDETASAPIAPPSGVAPPPPPPGSPSSYFGSTNENGTNNPQPTPTPATHSP